LRVTSWLRENLEPAAEPKVIEVVTEQAMEWRDLPQDVRDEYLRSAQRRRELDFVSAREREFARDEEEELELSD
jgi:hypothetical protein